MAFTALHHHIDLDLLQEAYRRTRKDGAVGVDGQTAETYAADLETNLQSLLNRFKSGTYQAPPVRRVHIPKGEGAKTRPIGIPTFEDKILQRAVAMVLQAIYEQDFLDCSFGFRPQRSAHQALEVLRQEVMMMGGGWVLEADIQKFFDMLDFGHLRGFLDRRVRDGVLRRTIDKWLKAGVLEEGVVTHPDTGTPQGGVISPLLANVYLHEVLDRWFSEAVQPRMRGRTVLVRYADDFVIVFSLESDARRVMSVLPKRFGRFGLTLHSEKTRLVRFYRPRREHQGKPSGANPGHGAFDLLGFTHCWARSRQGSWILKRQTAKARLRRSIHRVTQWCRAYRHMPVAYQHAELVRKLRGHYAYYGLTGNARRLGQFRHEVRRAWRKWLDRRSSHSKMTWERFGRLLERYPLPQAQVVHSIYRHTANP
jgi:group II intron reverse transcriptase/maturase